MSATLYAHKFPPPSEATLMEWSVSFYFGGCTWADVLRRQGTCICSIANEQTTGCADPPATKVVSSAQLLLSTALQTSC